MLCVEADDPVVCDDDIDDPVFCVDGEIPDVCEDVVEGEVLVVFKDMDVDPVVCVVNVDPVCEVFVDPVVCVVAEDEPVGCTVVETLVLCATPGDVC